VTDRPHGALGLTPGVSGVTVCSRSGWLREKAVLVSATGSGDKKPIAGQDLSIREHWTA